MASAFEILQIINNIRVGPLDRILERLDRARAELAELGQVDLVDKMAEARQALLSGDEAQFEKRLAYVTSKLGHLKA